MSLHVCRSLCVTFGFIIAAVGLLLGFYVFPKLVDKNIDDNVRLVNDTDVYKRWEVIPIPLHFKVYFLNVTNPADVQLGKKPIVNEIGPYIYDQHRVKYDISGSDDTLSYYQNQLFVFNSKASGELKEDDPITVANLPLMAIATIAETRGPLIIQALNRAIPLIFDNPKDLFLTTTVRDFLFDGIYLACDNKNNNGIVKRVCNEIRKLAPVQLEELEDGRFKFSLLSYKNNTHDGYYTIHSGTKDINNLGEITAWKNSSTLNVWTPNSTCNNIYGSDASIFPPHRNQLSKVNVFSSDICRSVNLHYHTEIQYKEITGLRYVLDDALISGSNFTSNECFCLNRTKGIRGEDGCLFDGALELWNCLDVPVVMTFPHFYLAHDIYKATVDGLKPVRDLHETYADIEPKSGTVLRGKKRVQFNIFYRKIDGIALTKTLADTLMPVVWVDEGVDLDDEHIELLNDSLFSKLKILDGVYWSLIGIGLAIGLIGMVWCMLFAHKPKDLF